MTQVAASATVLAPATDFHALVLEALERGEVIRTQIKVTKDSKEGFAYFKFRGGTFDGVSMRLYPPFEPFVHEGEVWQLERTFTKGGKQTRSIYLLKGDPHE